MAIGDSIAPTNRTTIMTSYVPGMIVGGEPVLLDTMENQGEYASQQSDHRDEVAFQQAKQNMPGTAAVDEVKAQFNSLRSSEDYKNRLAEAESIRRESVPVGFLGGMYTEVIPGRLTYDKQLIAAKSEVENSYKKLANTSTMKEWDSTYPEYIGSIEKYNSVAKTDPNSFPTQKINRYVQGDMSIGYQSPEMIAATNAQTASVLGGMISKLQSEGTRVTADQMSDWTNAVNGSGGTVSMSDPRVQSYLNTPEKSSQLTGPTYRNQFNNVLSAAQIQSGLERPDLTNRQRLFYLNEADKLRENIIGKSAQYHAWARDTGLPQPLNPWDFSGDTALNQQQLSRGLTGKNLTQLPSLGDYNKVSPGSQVMPNQFLANIPITDESRWMQTVNNANIDSRYQPVQNTNVSGFEFRTPFLSQISGVKTQKNDLTIPDTPFTLGLTGVLRNEVNKKNTPISATTLPPLPSRPSFSFDGQMSLNSDDIKTPGGYDETTSVKAGDLFTNLPIFGSSLNMIPLPSFEDNKFGYVGLGDMLNKYIPTSGLSRGSFLGNLGDDFSSNALITTHYGPEKDFKFDSGAAFTRKFINPDTGKTTDVMTFVTKPMTEQNKSLLNLYESGVKSFNNDIEVYKLLQKKYEQSPDENTFNLLNSQYQNLSAREGALNQVKGIVATIPAEEYQTIDLSKTKMRDSKTSVQLGNSNFGGAVSTITDILPKYQDRTGNTGILGITDEGINTLGGVYSEFKRRPDTLIGDAAIFAATMGTFNLAEGLTAKGIAGAAKSNSKILSTIGRAGSTPTASMAGRSAKWGLGGLYLYDTEEKIRNAPNAQERGKVLAHTSAQLAGAYLGAGLFKPSTLPANPYAGREFFSGERKLPLTTQARNWLSTKVQKGASTSPDAYEDVSTIFREMRNTEARPGIVQTTKPDGTFGYKNLKGFTEPDIGQAGTIGTKRAPAVKDAIVENQAVLKGSVVVKSQVSGMPSGVKAARDVADIDLLSPNKDNLLAGLKARGETSAGMDIKPPEKGYPDVFGGQKVNWADEPIKGEGGSWIRKLLGDPIRAVQGEKLPFSDEVIVSGKTYQGKKYTGKLSFEQLQVQFARKLQAFQEDLDPRNNEQYRIPKESWDVRNTGEALKHADQAYKGVKVGTSTKALDVITNLGNRVNKFDFIPKKDVPELGMKAGVRYKKTMTFGEMWKKMDKMGKERVEEVFGKDKPDLPEDLAKSQGSVSRGISSSSAGGLSSFSGIIHSTSPANKSSITGIYHKSSSKSKSSSISPSSSVGLSPSRITSMISMVSSPTPSPSKISSPSSPKSPSFSSITSPISPKSPKSPSSPSPSPISGFSGFSMITTFTTPSSPKSPKSPPFIPGSAFLMPPGDGGGGRGRGARSIKIKNPIHPLVVSTATTANRFSRAFGKLSSIRTVKPQGRGRASPVMSIKPQKATKSAKKVSGNILSMFKKKKGKKGRAF